MKNVEIQKYNYIDAIRGFAILGVVLVHSQQLVTPASDILSNIAAEGARGVQLFYIASALTLFLSMGARKEERPIVSFFIRRFFRIAPAFYTGIIIYTIYYGMSDRYWAPNGLEWWHILLTALFLHGLHPETITSVVPGGWSIAVEMTFYLLVPYLFIKINTIKKTIIALILSLFIAKIISHGTIYFLTPFYIESQQYLVNSFAFLSFPSQFPIFILGIMLYHIIKKYPQGDNQIAFILLLLSLFLFAGFLTSSVLPRHFLYGIAFTIFTLSLHYSPHNLLINKVTVFIGRLSFSIYLVHFMVLDIMGKVFSSGFILEGDVGFISAFILVLAISVFISYITYKVIEIPGINLGKYIVKKL